MLPSIPPNFSLQELFRLLAQELLLVGKIMKCTTTRIELPEKDSNKTRKARETNKLFSRFKTKVSKATPMKSLTTTLRARINNT